jgi:hypothetical protein
MSDALLRFPRQIYLICIGPLTNVAGTALMYCTHILYSIYLICIGPLTNVAGSVLVCCTHILYSYAVLVYCTRILCLHTVLVYCTQYTVLIHCTHILYSIYLICIGPLTNVAGSDVLYSYTILIYCTHIMYSYTAQIYSSLTWQTRTFATPVC